MGGLTRETAQESQPENVSLVIRALSGTTLRYVVSPPFVGSTPAHSRIDRNRGIHCAAAFDEDRRGSSTLRGFAQNAVGSIGPNRIPVGGEAMLILNNELRMPLVKIVDGVVFLDLGNVYEPPQRSVSHRSSEVLRRRATRPTPWVLLRGDYGIVVAPRPGEPRSRFYFSIGQAF